MADPGLAGQGISQSPAALPPCKILDQMRANPKADWTIKDVMRLCDQVGLVCSAPSSGSHYKISSELLSGILTVPAKRPIKAPYIKLLVSMATAHRASIVSPAGEEK